ncbi:putative ethanolamine-phosphate cytidylyltransferase [Escovopsis weberi]|uniref:ethanolamine-phosphate cytidylyltransferase n=1 Tax=Escovopsis weberi TaxID=150374 RepID=A0A0M8N3V9_ESCWE|nr:putative ethanolamine-phosphate cytidylyltransferase [Escovopsis weberi]
MTADYDESLEKPQGEPEPQLYEGRIWVDGCFDFFHHGHAGAIVQSRRLGNELYCGVHSDEAILKNKGPSVMNLAERHVTEY